MNFAINRIQHVGIPVTDIIVSESFYEKLGFIKVMTTEFDHQGGKGVVAMMERAEMMIELYQLPSDELSAVKNRKDGHVDHIAFDVADIDQAFIALKTADFHIVEAAPIFLPFWKNGCRYFNITGPDGERLEFNQIEL